MKSTKEMTHVCATLSDFGAFPDSKQQRHLIKQQAEIPDTKAIYIQSRYNLCNFKDELNQAL